MKLVCVSRFRGEEDGVLYDFTPGQDINVTEELAAHLLHRSPDSFKVPQPDKPKAEPKPEPMPEPDTSAISTETETGIVAPDRRARGGKRRKR